MKLIVKLSAPIILPILFSIFAFAQEGEMADRNANPGEDPNLAMVPQGQGVANIGCTDPTGSCYKRLTHVGLQKNTNFRPGDSTNSGASSGGRSEKGSR